MPYDDYAIQSLAARLGGATGRGVRAIPGQVDRQLGIGHAFRSGADALRSVGNTELAFQDALLSGLLGDTSAPSPAGIPETNGSAAYPTSDRSPYAPPPQGTVPPGGARLVPGLQAGQPAAPEPSVIDDAVAGYDQRGDRAAVEGFRSRQPESVLRPLMQIDSHGQGLSIADMEGRTRAMKALDDLFGSEEELRPHPMEDAIEARKRSLTYERLMPAGQDADIQAFHGHPLRGQQVISDVIGNHGVGGRTVEEQHGYDALAAKYEPDLLKASSEAELNEAKRQQIAGPVGLSAQMQKLRLGLNAAVNSGAMSAEDASRKWTDEVEKAITLSDIMKASVSRQRDDYSAMPATPNR